MREQDVVDSRYRIERKLAAGGFGAIYAATDLVMGREVALKVLHRELASDELLVARFRREAEALARLRDPHTITMYDVGADSDGTPYIVLELLRGKTLYQEFLDHGALPWRRMASIARGVCSSLREAHAVGIIHRDLKPANIHLEVTALHRDHVKLLDFGIAKMVDAIDGASSLPDLTLAGQMVGTFDYMPPEQLIGGACTGKRDVFALAVVMYEMIAGQLPFGEASGPAGRLMSMLSTLPAPLVDRATVPAELDMIVMRALAREPEDRPELEEIDSVLEALLDATALLARSAPAASPPKAADEISSLIEEALAENGPEEARAAIGRAETDEGTFPAEDEGAFPAQDDGTFTDDDADTWVGAPPQLTTVGLGPTRAPALSSSAAKASSSAHASNAAPDIETLLKPLGKRELPARPSRDADGTGKVTPRDALGTGKVTPRDALGTGQGTPAHPSHDALGTPAPPSHDALGTPAPELHRNASEPSVEARASRAEDSRFAVGSRTGIEPAKATDAASADSPRGGHLVLPRAQLEHLETPAARRVTPVQLPPPPPPRRTPMPAATTPASGSPASSSPTDSQAPTVRRRKTPVGTSAAMAREVSQTDDHVVDPLASTMSPTAGVKASAIDSQAQTARQPRRVITPPNGTMTTAGSARAELDRLAKLPQLPVVRMTSPSRHTTGGRPTPSELALPARRLAPSEHAPRLAPSEHALPAPRLAPSEHALPAPRMAPSEHALPAPRMAPSEHALPAPRLVPSGELPTVPSRMPTGTSPIANKPARVSIAKVAIWAVALFGVGFAAALAIAAM